MWLVYEVLEKKEIKFWSLNLSSDCRNACRRVKSTVYRLRCDLEFSVSTLKSLAVFILALFSHTNKFLISNLAYVLSTNKISPIVYNFSILFSILSKSSLFTPNTLYFSSSASPLSSWTKRSAR